jgi:uncharacterized membrane protein
MKSEEQLVKILSIQSIPRKLKYIDNLILRETTITNIIPEIEWEILIGEAHRITLTIRITIAIIKGFKLMQISKIIMVIQTQDISKIHSSITIANHLLIKMKENSKEQSQETNMIRNQFITLCKTA